MMSWDQIRESLALEIGRPEAVRLLRAEYNLLAVRLAAAVPASKRNAFLVSLLDAQDLSRADIDDELAHRRERLWIFSLEAPQPLQVREKHPKSMASPSTCF